MTVPAALGELHLYADKDKRLVAHDEDGVVRFEWRPIC